MNKMLKITKMLSCCSTVFE